MNTGSSTAFQNHLFRRQFRDLFLVVNLLYQSEIVCPELFVSNLLWKYENCM